ncbi:hypothetical protein BPT24_132 [Tenacibaculum phage pT24]|uniref:Uncharacterized protein n=1 Tax=Tenacibaculum phage pT24 TaxID=1880590 RepID=A0A1B4XWT4_9CAUD|nr:hypothetical protein HYP10_gp132 [Tenacibaculum phage pT24]BAV39257.1 hypothetical protein BPT24_132 [Tenacibaculum phage pT24]
MEQKNDYSSALGEVTKQENGVKQLTPKNIAESGHLDIIMDLLGYGGRFYPKGTQISIRPFSTKEVVYFTSLNENNPLEVDQAFKYLVSEVVKVRVGNVEVKDTSSFIYQFDRFALVLIARTYSDLKTDLTFEHKCENIADGKVCGHTQTIKIIPQNLSFTESLIDKYYDEKDGKFNIDVKSSDGKRTYGYFPLTIKENSEIMEFMISKRDDIEQHQLKAFIKLFPFMRNHLGDSKNWEDCFHAFRELAKEDVINMAKLAEKVSLTNKNEIINVCEKCGHSEGVPMRFPYGIKTIVFDKIEDDNFLL